MKRKKALEIEKSFENPTKAIDDERFREHETEEKAPSLVSIKTGIVRVAAHKIHCGNERANCHH